MHASIGMDQHWAYDQAVSDINKSGGIFVKQYGKKLPVELITIDDETDPGRAAAAVEKLIKQKQVDLILGGATAAFGTIPGAVAAEKHKIYYHATSCFIPPWKAHHFQWSTLFFFDLDEVASVPFRLWNTLPYKDRPKRPGLVMEDTFDGMAIRDSLKEKARQFGYHIVIDLPWTPGEKDYTSIVLRAKDRKVDALLVFGGTAEMVTLIHQMELYGLSVKYFQGWKGAWPNSFWQILGYKAQYIVSDGHWSERYPYPGSQELGIRYYEAFKKRSVSVGAFYALVQILQQAIEKAGTLDSQKVRQAVIDNTFDTIMGKIDYDKYGVGIYPAPAFQWLDGEQKMIYPREYSNHKLLLAPPWNKRKKHRGHLY